MKFIVGNEIRVVQPTLNFKIWCNENLIIPNPEYLQKVKRGVWLGNTPKDIVLFEKRGDYIIVPFGCFRDLYNRFGSEAQFESDFRRPVKVYYNPSINLYPYQEEALKSALRAKNGVIVMPCGAGKTQTALAIVAKLGMRCLWLTHTQDLLNQSMNRAKSCFELPNGDYGTITGGKVNIGKITFATVQTMCRLDLQKYQNEFDIVIVDECHKCVGSPTKVMQFYKVLSAINARYKFGLTATPKRNDGLEKSMFALLGGIIHEVPRKAVEGTTCPVKVYQIETGYKPDINIVLAGDGTINYSALVDDMVRNQDRFNEVFNAIILAGKCTLVLANRVNYIERLNREYQNAGGMSICLSSLGTSKKDKEFRKKSLEMLNNGTIDVIFATYQLAKEGLDVPNLRYVVFATPEKDETTVTQSAGRVGRKAEGKEFGTVIDLVDDFGMYKGWAKKRTAIYKKLNYVLEEKNGG